MDQIAAMMSCDSIDLQKKSPIVSIGMLAYNDENYVAQAIEDLLTQSFEDFELIISDDCSKDSTGNICRKYAATDERIRFFQQQNQLGMQKNYEFVLNQAQGQFFMWASSDDRWDREFVTVLLSEMQKDSVTAFCPFQFIDENGLPCSGKLEGIHTNKYSGRSTFSRIARFCFYYSDAFFYGLHRRELIQDVKVPIWWGMNSSIALNNNYPVLIFLLSRGQYHHIDKPPLFFKRVHLNSKPRHSEKFANQKLAGYLAFLLRKVNVFFESVLAVYTGSRSLIVTLVVLPLLLLRCLYDCASATTLKLYYRLRSRLRR